MSRILVAEDDPHILRLIAMWLKRQGHDVLEARNGLIARDLATQQIVDVLVTDVNMPGLDGLDLIAALLPAGRVRRGVVVLTNRWDHGDIADQLAAWEARVLPKPFSPTKLAEVIAGLTSDASPESGPTVTEVAADPGGGTEEASAP